MAGLEKCVSFGKRKYAHRTTLRYKISKIYAQSLLKVKKKKNYEEWSVNKVIF